MFCVSTAQGKRFIMLLTCGVGIFLLSAALLLKRTTLPMFGKFAGTRSAWYETCQQQHRLLLASLVLLPAYSNMLVLACTVVVDLGSTFSQQTCDADFAANDASTEKGRIRMGASWWLKGLQ
eukprot:4629026-Amphidinium_carterae.1